MVQFVTVAMVGGTIRRKVIHRESFQSLGPQPPLAAARCSSHRREEVSLDNAFALIEGHPEPSRSGKDAPPTLVLVGGFRGTLVPELVARLGGRRNSFASLDDRLATALYLA